MGSRGGKRRKPPLPEGCVLLLGPGCLQLAVFLILETWLIVSGWICVVEEMMHFQAVVTFETSVVLCCVFVCVCFLVGLAIYKPNENFRNHSNPGNLDFFTLSTICPEVQVGKEPPDKMEC